MRDAARQLRRKGEEKFDAVINFGTSMGYYGEKEDVRTFKSLLGVTSSRAISSRTSGKRRSPCLTISNGTIFESSTSKILIWKTTGDSTAGLTRLFGFYWRFRFLTEYTPFTS